MVEFLCRSKLPPARGVAWGAGSRAPPPPPPTNFQCRRCLHTQKIMVNLNQMDNGKLVPPLGKASPLPTGKKILYIASPLPPALWWAFHLIVQITTASIIFRFALHSLFGSIFQNYWERLGAMTITESHGKVILPYKRKQVMKVVFLINVQNVSAN